ncbi:pyocin knob domain-containing protein [Pseudomonas poae]|uniref:Phage tail protein n=1 Tax=Pseudomonas poae TaxID=200451 RepID=A0AAP2WK16_9PSED|nr:pyocin knob domain-containing protein [Pseudomonas poae]MCF5656056.1 phage tail protein [Pseudomonas poae]
MPSWFTEGTVTVANGNTVVNGSGTKFSNSRPGDMFVGPDMGIYQVVNPASDTSVSITPAYRGANAAGASYGIVPVNGYPKVLADAVNQMVLQWGTTLAGLGAVSTENVVPVAKGGTGGTTQATARTGLGLGSAATLNAGLASGNVLMYGAFGLGGRAPDLPGNSFNAIGDTGIYRSSGGSANSPTNYGYGTLFVQNYDAGFTAQHGTSFSGRQFFRINNNFSWGSWIEIYTTTNTTRSSDGTLKAI